MVDVLSLGGIVFDNAKYMPPNKMPFGGEQQMNVHKLPGGTRVYDILGPDEADISFSGFVLDAAAFSITAALDAMRAAGQTVALIYAGTYRQVIVKHFEAGIRRFPNWVEYSVSCSVSQNAALGTLVTIGGTPGTSIASLVQSDLATALALAKRTTFG